MHRHPTSILLLYLMEGCLVAAHIPAWSKLVCRPPASESIGGLRSCRRSARRWWRWPTRRTRTRCTPRPSARPPSPPRSRPLSPSWAFRRAPRALPAPWCRAHMLCTTANPPCRAYPPKHRLAKTAVQKRPFCMPPARSALLTCLSQHTGSPPALPPVRFLPLEHVPGTQAAFRA